MFLVQIVTQWLKSANRKSQKPSMLYFAADLVTTQDDPLVFLNALSPKHISLHQKDVKHWHMLQRNEWALFVFVIGQFVHIVRLDSMIEIAEGSVSLENHFAL